MDSPRLPSKPSPRQHHTVASKMTGQGRHPVLVPRDESFCRQSVKSELVVRLLLVGVGHREGLHGWRGTPGWRYLWEQVSQGAEDYNSADVARGEAGRWGEPVGREGRRRRVGFDRDGDRRPDGTGLRAADAPRTRCWGGARDSPARWRTPWPPPRSPAVSSRRRRGPRGKWTSWRAGASGERVEAEWDGHRQQDAEGWAEVAEGIPRGGDRVAVAAFDLTFSPPKS